MPQSWVFIAAYTVAFIVLVAGTVHWRHRSRKERAPFPENLKLLRGPGETQRRLLAELDERTVYHILFAFAAPLVVAGALLQITTHLTGTWQTVCLAVTLVALLASLLLVAQFLSARVQEWRNRYLGFFGERIVAEFLEPLKAQGFRVFHDVPCGDAKSPFNIDHVAVGPAGVFAIETKTRRKGRSREGFAAHEIIYDGQVLAYPWGEDRHGLDQALRRARWLENWLGLLLGQQPVVQPILTFPGWMIIRRGSGDVVVLNPKELPAALVSRDLPVLTAEQIDLIARQLDARCRDVEY
jgi:hypothetical protein